MPVTRISFLLVFLLISTGMAFAQEEEHPFDTNYYMVYPKEANLRLYLSQKFTGFRLGFEGLPKSLVYDPNTTRNLGVGFTYKWATLNLAYGFGFLNPNNGRGRTRYLDLQSHQYMGKWNIDVFAQFYKGYFLNNRPSSIANEYLRPDIRVTELGVTAQYVMNHERFSFKAAFLNTEYQKRSAGTWLLGGNVFYGRVKGDSALAPAFSGVNAAENVEEASFVKMGPLGGYAHTFVIKRHYYISTGLTVHLNVGEYEFTSENFNEEEFFFSTDFGIRSAIGYTSHHYNLGVMFVSANVHMSSDMRDVLQTGNFRIVATYRFDPQWDVPLIDKKNKINTLIR